MVPRSYPPMRLLRIPQPFDHPDCLFEPKIDGFRALAYVSGDHCSLVSRNGHVFKGWPQLAEEIAHAIRCLSVVLDGEICCLDPDGRSNFYRLMFRRDSPFSTPSMCWQSTARTCGLSRCSSESACYGRWCRGVKVGCSI